MIKPTYIFVAILTLFLFTACGKPDHHPKNPNYTIKKPKVVYTPSKKNLGKMVKKLNGSPYVWAEEGPNNFDCSGYTYYMYGSMGIELPRVAREQAKVGKYIKPTQLQYGDLIFFDTTKKRNGKITHVGMYLGDGWFTHASTTEYEIVYSNLRTSKYYKKRLRICRRYLPDHKTNTKIAGITTPWKTNSSPKLGDTIPLPVVAKKPSIKRPLIETASSGTYYVQVGSFTGKPKSALLNKITRNGLKYKMIQFSRNGTQISKLLIGPYKDKATALEVLPKVKFHIEKSAFIAEIL
jgi:hypothetical protein